MYPLSEFLLRLSGGDLELNKKKMPFAKEFLVGI